VTERVAKIETLQIPPGRNFLVVAARQFRCAEGMAFSAQNRDISSR
jgi:hypothetical protein